MRISWQMKDTMAGIGRHVDPHAVALTFDDGPHPSSTEHVLDVLAELQVVATFFCVGRNARAHPDLVRRILTEGHTVGSHSESHPHPAELSSREVLAEYRAGVKSIAAVAGRPVRLFRPPHGHLGYRVAPLLRKERLIPWLWTVDPQDWRPGVTADEIFATAATAGPGDVVLLHDWVEQAESPSALDRSATIAALPAVVDQIRRRGLTFVTLRETA